MKEKGVKQKTEKVILSNSWLLYLDAMKSPLTKYKYLGNLSRFLDFTKVEGVSLEERAKVFAMKGKKDTDWAFQNIARFIHFQKQRVSPGHVT